ncbi:MAG: type I secretion protein, partial [Celeribacter marinus]
MTFWWKCNDGGSTAPTGPDFNSDLVENLVGLWEFSSGGETKDTGLSDGIAQNGHFHGNAHAANGALQLDGNCDYFDVSGTDAPFDLSEGTVQVQFIQDHQVGTSPDTIVNRGEFCDKDTEGYFNIQVTANGAVTVSHLSGSDSLSLSTGAGFFDEGDELRVSYSWDDDGQGSFVVENLSEGTTYETDFDSAGLNMDIGDNDDENFTFGAREYDDGTYDQYFDGSIAYVAVFSDPSITTGSDGIVEGTDGDDIIDATYEGDPDGDMIDAGDARLAGEVGDDDIIYAGAGEDTILAGAGNDEIYGQGGDDTIDGGAGDDVIYGDASSGSTKVFTGEYVRESFEWNEAGVADEQALTDFTQDTGNVNVSFKVVQQDADAQTQFSSDQQKVHSIETDGPGADAHSSLDSNLNGHGNEATYELSFSDA